MDIDILKELKLKLTIKNIITSCNNNKNFLIGVSKDSNVKYMGITYEQFVTQAAFIQQKKGLLYYSPNINLPEILSVVYARLHKKARKWHRIDYIKQDDDNLIKDILEDIAKYSQYNVIYGTPITPQICHKLAVKISQHKPKKKRS